MTPLTLFQQIPPYIAMNECPLSSIPRHASSIFSTMRARGVADVSPMALTDLEIRALPIPEKRREIPDGSVRGLYLTLHPSGKRSWCVRYRSAGRKSHKKTIGVFPLIGLKRAREEARRRLEIVKLGYASGMTFGMAAAEFKAKYVEAKLRPSTRIYYERILERAIDAWGNTQLTEISRRHVMDEIDRTVEEHGLDEANTCWKCLGRFFRWCEGRDYIRLSPKRGTEKPKKETERDRVLEDDELRLVWKTGNAFFQMLILTGCRRDEIAALTWAEVYDGHINIPAIRTKTNVAHRIPITTLMADVLSELPRRGRFVMTGTSKQLTKGSYRCEVDGITERWSAHDLRRSFASGCARIGIAPHIVERMLNHKIASRMQRIYQRHKYTAEIAEGFARWSDHIATITSTPPNG